ncbi:MAG: Type 1 glutamine amidotransferase-like domain-containing protein [Acidimicrobiales bacterium]
MRDEPAGGPLALVGSGEYLPVMADVDADLLAGRPARYVQLATAAVPDGPDVVARWHRLGEEQARRLGVEPIILDVATREDAHDDRWASLVAGAGLIYLSGGHPAYLADTLRDTPVWAAIVDAWRSGSALAGCSAGAMALTSWVPSLRHPRQGATPGLGLLAHLRVIPHFDAFAARMPDVATRFLTPADANVTLLGIDEETAIVGGPHEWVVRGRQSAWRLGAGGRERLAAGTSFTTPA